MVLHYSNYTCLLKYKQNDQSRSKKFRYHSIQFIHYFFPFITIRLYIDLLKNKLAAKAHFEVMKVIIVEPDKQVIKKLVRILHTIDRSIEILLIITEVEALQERINIQPAPDLVLVNRKLLGDTHKAIEAKLIITSDNHHLVYLAFRINNLKYLQKYLLKSPAALISHPYNNDAIPAQSQAIASALLQQTIRKRFLVNYQQKLLSIAVEEIAYFFSDNRFIFFKTFDNRKFLVEYRMDELENILDKHLFFRINRSYIISIHSISVIYSYPGNRFKIVLNPPVEKEMIVSRERIANFKKWLGE
jgi:two-component system response regulator LytT